MEAIYKLMETIKKLFGGKEITITITSEPTISFTAGEFEKHVEDLLKQSK